MYILFRSRQKPITDSDTITLDSIALQQVEVTKVSWSFIRDGQGSITITMGSWDGPLEITLGGVTGWKGNNA